ncbi:hypothetical protein C2845_PM12G07330 [Panicum miliaceum]|uniref:Uncharacterized protein n=1 Tax=Panicum miliaceum TaxID=4540 RepID=A0A3L6QN62_PANMI|nr:hypothetical protein C2845_PM12G07330 [Panicum miliaceum]
MVIEEPRRWRLPRRGLPSFVVNGEARGSPPRRDVLLRHMPPGGLGRQHGLLCGLRPPSREQAVCSTNPLHRANKQANQLCLLSKKFFFPWLSANRQHHLPPSVLSSTSAPASSPLPTRCIAADQASSPLFFSTKETPAAAAPFAPIELHPNPICCSSNTQILSAAHATSLFLPPPCRSNSSTARQQHLSTPPQGPMHLIQPPPIHQHSTLCSLLPAWIHPCMMLSTYSMKWAQERTER